MNSVTKNISQYWPTLILNRIVCHISFGPISYHINFAHYHQVNWHDILVQSSLLSIKTLLNYSLLMLLLFLISNFWKFLPHSFRFINVAIREGFIRKKKKSCEFSQLWSWPPPLKVVKTPIIFFLTPWPKKHFVQIKKNSPLKTQNT